MTRTGPGSLRAGLAGAAVPLGLGVYLSFARGALAALAVGLLVLVALAPERRAQLRSAVVLVLASGVAALVASLLPTVKSLGERDSGDGLLMLAVLVLLAVAAALLAPRASRMRIELPSSVRSRPALLAAAAIAIAVVVGVAAAAYEGKPEGGTPATGADPAGSAPSRATATATGT